MRVSVTLAIIGLVTILLIILLFTKKTQNKTIIDNLTKMRSILLLGPGYHHYPAILIQGHTLRRINLPLPKSIVFGAKLITGKDLRKVAICQYLAPGTQLWLVSYNNKMQLMAYQRILKSSDYISPPAWSPDGSKLAFVKDNGHYGTLYIYDLKRAQLKKLYKMKIQWNYYLYYRLSFTSDGHSIIISTPKIIKIDIDTGLVHQLGYGLNPESRPNGEEILIAQNGSYCDEKRYKLINFQSNISITLIENAIDATWSPNGEYIAFIKLIKGIRGIWELFKSKQFCDIPIGVYILSLKDKKQFGPIKITYNTFLLTWLEY